MLQDLLGTQLDLPVRVAIAAVVIAVLLGLTVLIVRRLSGAAAGPGGRSRQARLAVLDSVPVDQRRRLVLVRRDETEHLLLVGGPSDLVVETSIPRGGRETAPVRDALPSRETTLRDALPRRPATPALSASSEATSARLAAPAKAELLARAETKPALAAPAEPVATSEDLSFEQTVSEEPDVAPPAAPAPEPKRPLPPRRTFGAEGEAAAPSPRPFARPSLTERPARPLTRTPFTTKPATASDRPAGSDDRARNDETPSAPVADVVAASAIAAAVSWDRKPDAPAEEALGTVIVSDSPARAETPAEAEIAPPVSELNAPAAAVDEVSPATSGEPATPETPADEPVVPAAEAPRFEAPPSDEPRFQAPQVDVPVFEAPAVASPVIEAASAGTVEPTTSPLPESPLPESPLPESPLPEAPLPPAAESDPVAEAPAVEPVRFEPPVFDMSPPSVDAPEVSPPEPVAEIPAAPEPVIEPETIRTEPETAEPVQSPPPVIAPERRDAAPLPDAAESGTPTVRAAPLFRRVPMFNVSRTPREAASADRPEPRVDDLAKRLEQSLDKSLTDEPAAVPAAPVPPAAAPDGPRPLRISPARFSPVMRAGATGTSFTPPSRPPIAPSPPVAPAPQVPDLGPASGGLNLEQDLVRQLELTLAQEAEQDARAKDAATAREAQTKAPTPDKPAADPFDDLEAEMATLLGRNLTPRG